jgi:hypothetical protein
MGKLVWQGWQRDASDAAQPITGIIFGSRILTDEESSAGARSESASGESTSARRRIYRRSATALWLSALALAYPKQRIQKGQRQPAVKKGPAYATARAPMRG